MLTVTDTPLPEPEPTQQPTSTPDSTNGSSEILVVKDSRNRLDSWSKIRVIL